MDSQALQGLRVAILATDGVEQSELAEPRKALDQAGAKTILLSPKSGKIQGMQHHDKDREFDVDGTLDEAKPNDFDAVLLPGGALNADALRIEQKAQELIRGADRDAKPIAVICHGPWLLVSAGLVQGHTLTSYHTIQDDLRNAGANWVDKETVRDGTWLSSRNPKDIPAFNREMIKLFQETAKPIRRVA